MVARWTSLPGRDDPAPGAVRTVTWLGGAAERMRWRRATAGCGETAEPVASNDVDSYAESRDWRDDAEDNDDAVAVVTPDASDDALSVIACRCLVVDDSDAESTVPTDVALSQRDLQQISLSYTAAAADRTKVNRLCPPRNFIL